MQDFFDKAVRHIGSKTGEKIVINIGAMDGTTYDELSGYTSLFGFKGLYVEPIPHLFEKLKSNFPTPGNMFENSAISDYNGEIRMLTIEEEAIKTGKINECFYGMSAVIPPKNGLGSEGDKETVEKYGKEITVPCITFDKLVENYQIKHFEVLKIDAEGHDWIIVKTIDLDKYRPSVIRTEWKNLNDQEKFDLTEKFKKHNYMYEVLYGDITAITTEIYDEIYGSDVIQPVKEEVRLPEPTENMLFASVLTNHNRKKHKVSFEVFTYKDFIITLNKAFDGVDDDITDLFILPIFEDVPIKFERNECEVNDFLIKVSTDGITLSFDNNPFNREKDTCYKSNKLLSSLEIPNVISWLEGMTSEEVYKMAKLTFLKV